MDVHRRGRVVLRICLDVAYPGIVEECAAAMALSMEPWQQQIVDRHPDEFVRGLIHSDGCRTINRFKTTLPSGRVAEYAYARYFFSNLSADIRGLFCATCDALGVRWTLSNPCNVSVAHRKSVAVLDALGCAKD